MKTLRAITLAGIVAGSLAASTFIPRLVNSKAPVSKPAISQDITRSDSYGCDSRSYYPDPKRLTDISDISVCNPISDSDLTSKLKDYLLPNEAVIDSNTGENYPYFEWDSNKGIQTNPYGLIFALIEGPICKYGGNGPHIGAWTAPCYESPQVTLYLRSEPSKGDNFAGYALFLDGNPIFEKKFTNNITDEKLMLDFGLMPSGKYSIQLAALTSKGGIAVSNPKQIEIP